METTLPCLDKRILRRLFSFFTLTEKVKLALLHNNFGDIFKDTLDQEVIIPQILQMNFAMDEIHFILSNYGAFAKRYEHVSLSGDSQFEECLRYIRTYCTNLQEITLVGFEITPSNHHGQLLALSKQLKTLKLKRCTIGDDACSLLLADLSQLQSLDLENSKVTGKGLGALTNLIELNLKNCQSFNCTHLNDIFAKNRLKSLNIVSFGEITTPTLDILIRTQLELEKVTLGSEILPLYFKRICTLKNLREISMVNMLSDPVDYLEVLVAEKKNSLECVEVYVQDDNYYETKRIIYGICELQNLRILSFRNWFRFDCHNLMYVGKACRRLEMLDLSGSSFTDMAIVNCLEYLECLQHLDISYCLGGTHKLYFRLVELRRDMRFSRPLVIYIKPRMEIASLLKSEEYLPGMNGVWLTLGQMRLNYEDSLLERLDYLNDIQYNKYKPINSSTNPISVALPEDCPLFRLDNNCLFHIIQYLSPTEKLNLLLTSAHFVDIVKYFLETEKIHFLGLSHMFTLRDARGLLSRYGHMIRRLNITIFSSRYYPVNVECLDLIAEFCTNLVELNCRQLSESERLLRILKASVSTLETLRIERCLVPDSLSLELANAQKLQTLILERIHLTGGHLDKLTNLTTLHLHGCTLHQLGEICLSNRLLELNIEGCRELDVNAFRVITETQQKLKRISLKNISADMNLYVLANLKSLEHIELVDCQPEESLQFLSGICEKQSNQIKSFIFYYDQELNSSLRLQLRENIMKMKNLRILRACYFSLNDEDIEIIVDSCSQLEILDVSFGGEMTEAGIIYPMIHLEGLRHYHIGTHKEDDHLAFYRKTVKIGMECFPDRSMNLHWYLPFGTNIIDALKNTKEYVEMKKYVSIESTPIPKPVIWGPPQKPKTKCHPRTKSIPMVEDHPTSTPFSIVDLPDKCLRKIAFFLEPIDRLTLASIHSRLMNSSRSLINGMIFDLNAISKAFTLLEAKNLFRICNNLIRRIRFANGFFEYQTLIGPYSQYLSEIYIEGCNFCDYSEKDIEQLFASPMQKLEKLIFHNCTNTTKILSRLSDKKKLRILKTREWPTSDPESAIAIIDFRNLQELYLENCPSFNISNLRDICENCKLRVLDLRGAICVSAEVSKLLLETQDDCLEHLAVSSDIGPTEFSDDIAKLSNLKHIVVRFDDFKWVSLIGVLVYKLILYHSHDLLSLCIIFTLRHKLDYSWFQMIEAKCCKFRELQKFEIFIGELAIGSNY